MCSTCVLIEAFVWDVSVVPNTEQKAKKMAKYLKQHMKNQEHIEFDIIQMIHIYSGIKIKVKIAFV